MFYNIPTFNSFKRLGYGIFLNFYGKFRLFTGFQHFSFCVSSNTLLGLIPGSIAENKGHNFLIWWIYGYTLFIVAVIHVQFISNKKPPSKRFVYRFTQAPDQNASDTLKILKDLLDFGAITQEDFEKKKKEILGS